MLLYQYKRLAIVRGPECNVSLLIDGAHTGSFEAEHHARRVAAIWLVLHGHEADQKEAAALARALPLRRPVPWLVPWG
jgi:hypothetical protein